MSLSTRLMALVLVGAAVGPARAQLSAAADSSAPVAFSVRVAPSDSLAAPSASTAPGVANAASATLAPAGDVATIGATIGAPLTGLRAGVHARETARPLQPTAAPAHANLGQARAMMIVGVAGLVAGAIIGGTPGTVVMVGGAVVGLFGLYDYLQ